MQPDSLSQGITLQPHLSIEELERRYRQAKAPFERSQFQIIWLIAQGKLVEEVAAITGYNNSLVYQLIQRYNQLGAEAVTVKRYNSRGLYFIWLGV
jgi:DNA-binding CsgD family transcriptional regulator